MDKKQVHRGFFYIEIKMKSVFKPLEFHSSLDVWNYSLKRSLNKWPYMTKIDQEEEEEEEEKKIISTEMFSKWRRECRNEQW